jgi:hypothetical protein
MLKNLIKANGSKQGVKFLVLAMSHNYGSP